jgi:hypothetical protein
MDEVHFRLGPHYWGQDARQIESFYEKLKIQGPKPVKMYPFRPPLNAVESIDIKKYITVVLKKTDVEDFKTEYAKVQNLLIKFPTIKQIYPDEESRYVRRCLYGLLTMKYSRVPVLQRAGKELACNFPTYIDFFRKKEGRRQTNVSTNPRVPPPGQ